MKIQTSTNLELKFYTKMKKVIPEALHGDFLLEIGIQGAARKSEHLYINKVFIFSRRTVYIGSGTY